MTKKIFQIGNFVFGMNVPKDMVFPANFLLFRTAEKEARYTYHLEYADSLEMPEKTPVAEREDFKVYLVSGYETRLLGVRGQEGYYALYEEMSDTEARIRIDLRQKELFLLDTVFSSLFALERKLLAAGGLVLHCAWLRYRGEAILFSAPSGVGKSTQASLWETYKDGEVINGDRALLLRENDGYGVYGWPVCGSSEICRNVTIPLRAIVMLSQGPVNKISRLNSMQAFTELYGQITVNSWNKEAVTRSMELLEQLIQNIPVFHLSCTISKEAVELLAAELGL